MGETLDNRENSEDEAAENYWTQSVTLEGRKLDDAWISDFNSKLAKRQYTTGVEAVRSYISIWDGGSGYHIDKMPDWPERVKPLLCGSVFAAGLLQHAGFKEPQPVIYMNEVEAIYPDGEIQTIIPQERPYDFVAVPLADFGSHLELLTLRSYAGEEN